ncbi:MAG: hypothetical protein GY696_26000 [Gammaproteobacteria bacterium]|nr:hypothetical protein [Gammaproteobacteria bacterium]
MSNSPKTSSERISVTVKASESQPKKKEDWTTKKGSKDDLRTEVDKIKKNREKGNHQDRGKKRDNETRASTSKQRTKQQCRKQKQRTSSS